MSDSLENTKQSIKGKFKMDLVNAETGIVDYSFEQNNKIQAWVTDFLLIQAAMTTAFTTSYGSHAWGHFQLFNKIMLGYDDNAITAEDNRIPKTINYYGLPLADTSLQSPETIKNGRRTIGVMLEIGTSEMNNVPINCITWISNETTTARSNSYYHGFTNQTIYMPSYQMKLTYDPTLLTSIEVIARNRFAIFKYTKGGLKHFRFIDMKAEETLFDSYDDDPTRDLGSFSYASSPYLVFIGSKGTASVVQSNYFIDFEEGTVTKQDCPITGSSIPVSAGNVDENSCIYSINSINTTEKTLSIRIWDTRETNYTTKVVDLTAIVSNLPDIFKPSFASFSSTSNFDLIILEGKPYIRLSSYTVLSGTTAPSIKPLFDLEGNLVQGHFLLSNNSRSYHHFILL